MAKKRVFTSFDFDNDEDLRNLVVGQSKKPDSPFEMEDWSVKEPMTGNWKEKVRTRIKKCEIVAVICGLHAASGVNAEIQIAQEEKIPYFLLSGRKGNSYVKPSTAKNSDKVYDWTWDNLKTLIGGGR